MNKKVKYVLSIATVILAAGLARADSINKGVERHHGQPNWRH